MESERSPERSLSFPRSLGMAARPTLKQVASKARVSYQTVSKVINGKSQASKETEARIWDAVRALGYQPDDLARNLRTRRSRMIGYSWVPLPPHQINSILDQFLQGMMDAAARSAYHILPFPPGRKPDSIDAYCELINTGRVDGFVLSSVTDGDPRIAYLQDRQFPFVAFGRDPSAPDHPYVEVDGCAGIRMAVEHLIERGHRRIAVLAWPDTSRVGRERLTGYLQALANAEIQTRPNWIMRGEGSVAFGRDAARRVLGCPVDDRPTAIAALNDAMAIGAMLAAAENGLRVGADLAITGFDDTPMAQYLTPPLTSVRQPIWQVAQQIISILVGILNDSPLTDRHVLLAPEIVIRESSNYPFFQIQGAASESPSTA